MLGPTGGNSSPAGLHVLFVNSPFIKLSCYSICGPLFLARTLTSTRGIFRDMTLAGHIFVPASSLRSHPSLSTMGLSVLY